MDFLTLGVGGSSSGGGGDDHHHHHNNNNNAFNSESSRKANHRHTPSQIQRLEAFFKECPHPDENQRSELGRELGLETKQIKFWFQNKRTQMKTLTERMDNNVLRAENERMQCENLAIKEALKTVNCPQCGGPAALVGTDERELTIQKLLQENAHLRQEYEKMTKVLASYIGRPTMVPPPPPAVLLEDQAGPSTARVAAHGPSLSSSAPPPPLPLPLPLPPLNNPVMTPIPIIGNRINENNDDNNSLDANELRILESQEVRETTLMKESATVAMEEVVRLVRVNEPLWMKYEGSGWEEEEEDGGGGGFLVMNPEFYERVFPRAVHFKAMNIRVESSKATRVVRLRALELVDMFLDPEKWVNFFPTIVARAKITKVIETGSEGTRNGALQMMYEEMHMLTPMVVAREFAFLRYCYQMDVATWVIADVSFHSFEDDNHDNHDPLSASNFWRLPSGCMIHQLPNGSSKVTWVEHVGMDGKILIHRLYRHLIYNNIAYGAERWLVSLQRTCDRMVASSFPHNLVPSHEAAGGVVNSGEGRKRVMKVGERMMRMFSGGLNMSGGRLLGLMGEEQIYNNNNNINGEEIKVCIRRNVERGQPDGMILIAATSLWLPLPPPLIFDFLRDPNRRLEWDVLSGGNLAQEIDRISTGTQPTNYISIIRPLIPSEGNVVIVQETRVEPLGHMVVYAPVDMASMDAVTNGAEDLADEVQILPSGFVVTTDGLPVQNVSIPSSSGIPFCGGSILTVAFQILACSPSTVRRMNIESVASLNDLVSKTIYRIKHSLNC